MARRDRSVAEIQRALAQRGYPKAEVADVIVRLEAQRALDDARYAERFARSRLAHAGQGRHRIRQDLRRRGLDRKVGEAGLAAALAEVDEAAAMERQARLYWARRTAEEPRERLRKLWAFLLRRGYPGDLVSRNLKDWWPRWRDALDGLEPFDQDD